MLEYKTMSLIEKNDVIKAIGEEVLNVTRNMPWSAASKEMARNTLYALKQAVQVMPEIETRGWISVKERMPEKSMLVLGVVHGHVGELAYINDRNIFKRREHPIEGVTHWMQLPDAPEVDDE